MEGRHAPATADAPEEVLALLPDGWRLDGGPALDLDEAIESGEAPPLSLPDASFRLIWSRSGFTAMADAWAEWLLEAGRLLAEDGIAVVGLADREDFEQLTGEAWDDSRIGMTVLDAMEETSPSRRLPLGVVAAVALGTRVRANRAAANATGCGTRCSASRSRGITAEQLERPAEGDERELAAASANACYLRSQVDLLAKRHRHELAELREETGPRADAAIVRGRRPRMGPPRPRLARHAGSRGVRGDDELAASPDHSGRSARWSAASGSDRCGDLLSPARRVTRRRSRRTWRRCPRAR